MTIIVGLPCTDGVLLGTDSMASAGRIASEVEKARTLKHHPIIWGMSGSAFMIQQTQTAIDKAEKRQQARPTPLKIAEKLRDTIKEAWQVPVVPPGSQESDREAHSCEAVVLGWSETSGPSMIHLPADLAPIQCTDRPFIVIGSGHELAAAACEALSHHLDPRPTLDQASLFAYRVISIVCRVSSWGVALPVQIAVANENGARLLRGDELEEIETGVQRWIATDASNFLEAGTTTDLAEEGLPVLGGSRLTVSKKARNSVG
jgi:ATP-dependent protease HslVU (ClpYQ) peptidase subunit